MNSTPLRDAIVGAIWGTAVGDALGLPCEGLTPRRQQRLFPDISRYHLLFGRGMLSDDTEHTWMVARALLLSEGDPAQFGRHLAWQLRLWLLALPGGIGLATLRATLKLCIGIPPGSSGVFSAGNGPAMRSVLLGVCYGRPEQREQLKSLVRANTRITHTDPKAEYGALAVALAGAISAYGREGKVASADTSIQMLQTELPAEAGELTDLLERVRQSLHKGEPTTEFAATISRKPEKGVSGYIYETVPVALHAWLSHPRDYEQAVRAVIRCGGDTDTTAAIVGALVGAAVGKAGIPTEWRTKILEWPRTLARMEELGIALANMLEREAVTNSTRRTTGHNQGTISLNSPVKKEHVPLLNPIGILGRNLFFIFVILLHGFRRLFPPY